MSKPNNTSKQKEIKLGVLRVGTAGWTKASWRGPFHPRGTKTSSESLLDALQQHFRTVEVNGTCHSMPKKDTVSKWQAGCGNGFLMSPKMVKYVTHEKGCPNSEDALKALRTFADTIAFLGENLGPILIQFPRTKRLTSGNVLSMSRVIEESDLPSNAKIALELRNEDSLKDPHLLKEVRRLQWCLVMHPNSVGRGTVIAENREGLSSCHGLERLDENWPTTAGDWMYVRLHYNNDEHSGRYNNEELQKQAVPTIVSWLRQGIDVYAYLLNDDEKAAMPQNAKSLERICYGQLGCPVPKAPKQAKSIASFFAAKKRTAKSAEAEAGNLNPKRKKK